MDHLVNTKLPVMSSSILHEDRGQQMHLLTRNEIRSSYAMQSYQNLSYIRRHPIFFHINLLGTTTPRKTLGEPSSYSLQHYETTLPHYYMVPKWRKPKSQSSSPWKSHFLQWGEPVLTVCGTSQQLHIMRDTISIMYGLLCHSDWPQHYLHMWRGVTTVTLEHAVRIHYYSMHCTSWPITQLQNFSHLQLCLVTCLEVLFKVTIWKCGQKIHGVRIPTFWRATTSHDDGGCVALQHSCILWHH